MFRVVTSVWMHVVIRAKFGPCTLPWNIGVIPTRLRKRYSSVTFDLCIEYLAVSDLKDEIPK